MNLLKRLPKIIIFTLFFGLLFFFIGFFSNNSIDILDVVYYNQNRGVFAHEEEEEEEAKSRLLCGKEIPIGEAREKTGKLINDLILQLNIIDENAYYQIKAAEEMIALANQCDVEKCDPVDCDSYTEIHCPQDEECFEITYCSPKPCESPWLCHGIYRACPQCQIEIAFEKVIEHYNEIEKAKKEIWALINGIDNGVDRRESLCDKLNEDIRTTIEKGLCIGCPVINNPLCPKITIIEAIERKLDKARDGFDKCYLPCPEWEKVTRGELSGKFLMSCELVMSQDFPRETKTTEKVGEREVSVCTSLHNYFCCY